MKTNIRLVAVSLLLLLATEMQAISPGMVYACSAFSGLVPASMLYKALADKSKFRAFLIAPVVGMISGVGAHRFLHKFTACGKIEKAEYLMRTVRNYLFARESFDTDDELLQEVMGLYLSHEWPLIMAYNDLMLHKNVSLQAINMAQDAQQEDPIYAVRAERVKQVMYTAIEKMNKVIKCIRIQKDYALQLGKFRETQHQKDLLKAQQSAMIAQWFNVVLQVVDLWLQWNKTSTPHQTTPAVAPVQQQAQVIQEPCYESESCCVCLEDFGKENKIGVQRIIVRPCGHDICKTCAQQLFFGVTKAQTCPTCRTAVDLNRLQTDLSQKA